MEDYNTLNYIIIRRMESILPRFGKPYPYTLTHTPLSRYYQLVDSCTKLDPNRKHFVTLRTVNRAAKAQWERELNETK